METPDFSMMHQEHIRDYLISEYNMCDSVYDTDIYIIKPKLGPKIIKFLYLIKHPGDDPDADSEDDSEDPFIEKLYNGTMLKQGYEFLLGNDFAIEFAFSINKTLEDKLRCKKYKALLMLLAKNGIEVLYFDNEDYPDKLQKWISA